MNTHADCWPWPGRVCNGRAVHGSENAARAMWRTFFGDIPDGLSVCHHCDNPVCVNPSHLFLGTASDNAMDCVVKGRWGNPRRSGKRPDRSANPIWQLRRRLGLSQLDFGALLGVDQASVSRWEAGRAQPHGSAAKLLASLEESPPESPPSRTRTRGRQRAEAA